MLWDVGSNGGGEWRGKVSTTLHWTTYYTATRYSETTLEMDKMDIIMHSEGCETATVRSKCKQCLTKYERERKRNLRLKRAANIKVTRSVINKTGSKYKHILCINCKDKHIRKKLCSECQLKYGRAKQIAYNSKVRKRKLMTKVVKSVKFNDDVEHVQTKDIIKNVKKNTISSLEFNNAVKSMCQVKKKCEIQTNNMPDIHCLIM